ncbi:MAG: SdpI family protein [Asticcacaulis sp.]
MKWPISKGLSLLAVAGCAGLSLWARGVIPDGPVATHFNTMGQADGFQSRDTALSIMPLTLAAVTLLLWVLPYMQPQKGKLERSAVVYAAAWIGTVLVLSFAHVFIIGHALGWTLSVRPMLLAPGILFIVLGNVLPKTRYNYLVGVRTPWTLADECVWDRTHRLAGPLMMLGGIVMCASALLVPVDYLRTVFLAAGLIPALVSVAASYLYARALHGTKGQN